MLEDAAFLAHQLVEHGLAIVLVSGPDDMVVGAGDDADRVELDEAQPADQGGKIQRPGGRGGEALRMQPETPRVPVADFKRRLCHSNRAIWPPSG